MYDLDVKLKLEEIIESPNIAESIKDSELKKIAGYVINTYQRDRDSRSDWERETERALELAKMERKKKNTPWPNASNVKYPLISTAALQFSARTYPEVVRNDKVVEVAVIGADPSGEKEDRAKRVSRHMSYQLLIQNSDWEEGLDKLLNMLPIVGTVFKKTYFDSVKQRNVSEVCLHDEIYIHNDVKCLDEARRITHKLNLHKNDIIERIRAGIYSDVPDEALRSGIDDLDMNLELNEVLEQHTYLDLDGDGYEEPYVVTVLKSSGNVLRIVARFDPEDIDEEDGQILRIRPIQYFTDFHFIPSPDGTYYSLGFGRLLLALNESVNTILNQLIDAGTLSNMQGGFVGRGLRLKSGQVKLRPGQWQKLDSAGVDDIRKQLLPVEYKEPSAVLFQLLGLLIDGTKELASINEAMTGQEQAQNVPATTILALIEQGQKVFSSIQRRLFRALKKEFEKLYRLNRIFLDPEEYQRVLDEPVAILQNDYEDLSLDINPVADPSMSSDAQRLARSQANLALVGQPGINNHEIFKRYLEDLNTPQLEKILPPPDPNAPPPLEVIELQSKMDDMARKLELKSRQIDIREQDTMIRAIKAEAEMEKLRAEAIESIAKAEAAELGSQLEAYKAQVDALAQSVDLGTEEKEGQPIKKADGSSTPGKPVKEQSKLAKESLNDLRRLSSVEGAPGNPESNEPTEGS